MSAKAGTSLLTIVGMCVVGFVSYQAGRTKGQEQREALQREILRIQAVALKRNAVLTQLRAHVATVDTELNALGVQREGFAQFVDWLAAEHPDVLARYQTLEQAETEIADLERQTAIEHGAARQQYAKLQQRFPEEAAKLTSSDLSFLD